MWLFDRAAGEAERIGTEGSAYRSWPLQQAGSQHQFDPQTARARWCCADWGPEHALEGRQSNGPGAPPPEPSHQTDAC